MATGTSNKEFLPAWWLPERHSQTLWRKLSPAKPLQQKRQRVELDDGDYIDIDWASKISPESSNNRTLVFLLHGLCGCSSSPYMQAMQSLLAENGFASVAMNFRGCSGEVNRLARAYHSGVSEDLEEVFNKVSAEYPTHNFVFVGYSLGGNVLLKWLGEAQPHPNIQKAVAVSTPFLLQNCSSAMLKGVGRLYGQYFVRRLLKNFQSKQEYLQRVSPDQAKYIAGLDGTDRISTVWEFDDRITAPLHGFSSAEDYYQKCSSSGFLKSITTDTLLIQSRDDPLIPMNAIPTEEMLSSSVELQLTDKGGHVGFISSNRGNWLEQRILNFMQE